MAVTATQVASSLNLIVQTGTDANDKPIYRTRAYNRVKVNAEDQAFYDAGQALAGVQKHPLMAVNRVNEVQLTEI